MGSCFVLRVSWFGLREGNEVEKKEKVLVLLSERDALSLKPVFDGCADVEL